MEKKLDKAIKDIVIIVANAYNTAYASQQTTSVSNFFKTDPRYYDVIVPNFIQAFGFMVGEDLKQCIDILRR